MRVQAGRMTATTAASDKLGGDEPSSASEPSKSTETNNEG